MELWIRSQKNEKLRQGLFKVNEIELGDYDDDMNCLVANNLYCIGIYKSKQRALEILDEIQELITINQKIKGNYEDCDILLKSIFVKNQCIICQMPKE